MGLSLCHIADVNITYVNVTDIRSTFTFGFTLDLNSGLLSQSSVFVRLIHDPSLLKVQTRLYLKMDDIRASVNRGQNISIAPWWLAPVS